VRDPRTLLWLEVAGFKPRLTAEKTGLSLKVTVGALPHADDISPILKRLGNYDWVFGNVSVGTCSSDRSLTLHFVYFSFSRLAEDYSGLGEILENKTPLDKAIYKLLSKTHRTEVARMLLQIDDLPQDIKIVALSKSLEKS
jgi:hypothetical protein